MALNPELLVLDEPVSALDVSVQSQVLNLLMGLQAELQLTYLLIAHDLAVVKHVSDVIAVMYLGKIVEFGPAEELYLNPIHAYTKALISAIPIPDPTVKRKKNCDSWRSSFTHKSASWLCFWEPNKCSQVSRECRAGFII